MKGTNIDYSGDLSHAQFLGMVRLNKSFGFGDHGRLRVVAFDKNPVAEDGKVLSKQAKQLDHRCVLPSGHDARPEVRLTDFAEVQTYSPLG
jgi:hypothetical protein